MKYNNILGLLAGLGLIALTMNGEDLLSRSISFIGLIISAFFLIKLFNSSDRLLQKILPNTNRINLLDKKTVYYSSTVALFLGLTFFIAEILRFERVLRPGDFWRTYYSMGIVIALLTIYLLPTISSDLYASGKRRFSITWGSLIGIPLIVVGTASISNRVWSSENLYSEKFTVVDRMTKKARKSNSLHYQLTVTLNDGQSKDLMVEESLYNTTYTGDSVLLTLRNGLLGFEIIEEIKAVSKNSTKQ